MSWEEVIKEAQEAIANCDEDKAVAVARQAIDAGLDLVGVLNEGFSAGIRKVGDMFGRGEIFLPELILSAEVMKRSPGFWRRPSPEGPPRTKGDHSHRHR